MTKSSGDRFTIRIGGDANGPVVAGHENQVEVHKPQSEPQSEPRPPADEDSGSIQENVAKDNAALYTVQNGELHVHHDGGSHETPREE
ncbi:hypothetical protein [Streptomyces sp. NPDC002851]